MPQFARRLELCDTRYGKRPIPLCLIPVAVGLAGSVVDHGESSEPVGAPTCSEF